MKNRGLIKTKAVCILESASLREASARLIKYKISGMPVIDRSDNLVGFVSERDIILAISLGNIERKRAKDIMTKKVISIRETASIEDASDVFHKYPLRYVPVTKKRKVVGIVSRKDVINKLLGQYY